MYQEFNKNKNEYYQFINKFLDSIIDDIFDSKDNYNYLKLIKFENNIEINNSPVPLEKYIFNDFKIDNVDFTIIKNCRQLRGYLCGYHTIFNIKNYIKFLKMKINLKKENILSEQNSYGFYLKKMNSRSR
jgi:hypothetical protein